jgi:oligopeptide transport system ATP-binding protein
MGCAMRSIPRTGEQMSEALLTVRNLDVTFRVSAGEVHAVKALDLDVAKGETVAIVGESGSGKSQAALAVMGLIAANGRATGSVCYRGKEILGRSRRELNKVRGSKIAMIFQEPMTSLDPLFRIGCQLALPLVHHQGMSRAAARRRAIDLLDEVGIDDPDHRIDGYPHELSGGQRQRVMIAMALANGPELLIADEPTTALDVTVQARILALLAHLKLRHGLSMMFITHDLGLVRRFADRCVVLRAGAAVERGPTRELFEAPGHAYTRMLLAAEPRGRKAPVALTAPILLEARDVSVTFALRGGLLRRKAPAIRAVDGISMTVRRGETVGVVGESGSGKSTLGRALLRLVPCSGLVSFEDRALMPIDRRALRPLRRHLQLVFQDPYGSLSPRLTAGEIVTEGLLVHEKGLTRAERDRRAAEAFAEIQLEPGTRHRFPHEFSGGQRQRIAIARAMILKPKLVVLDEPTSALDRSVQMEIVELLRRLQAAHGLAYVFISHDLAIVRALADRILVMRQGRAIETGQTEDILTKPKHAYTRELITAAFSLVPSDPSASA